MLNLTYWCFETTNVIDLTGKYLLRRNIMNNNSAKILVYLILYI